MRTIQDRPSEFARMATRPNASPPSTRGRLVRRLRPSVGLAVVATLLIGLGAGAGWVASWAVTSPAQTLAEAAPPAHSLLTETVMSGRVSQSVTFDADVEARLSLAVIAPAPAEGAAPVITRLPVKRGARVHAGDLVAEVSGRPVILLPGELPAYRTLSPGLSGPDVKQLQHALSTAGYFQGSADGVYGPVTAAAVAVLYEHHGYDAVTVGTDEVEAAAEAVEQARRALAQLPSAAKSSEERFAHDDLVKAKAQLITARAASGAQIPMGEVLFVSALPATVADVPVGVGKAPGEALLTLNSGALVARGTPNPVDGGKVEIGDRVRLLLSPTGETNGMVTSIEKAAPSEEDAEGQGGGLVFTITTSKPIPAASAGTAARAIVTTESSPKEGLVIPESALSVNAAGDTTVTTLGDGGAKVRVRVTAGFSGDGLVQVAPTRPNALSVGDRVVVGVSR